MHGSTNEQVMSRAKAFWCAALCAAAVMVTTSSYADDDDDRRDKRAASTARGRTSMGLAITISTAIIIGTIAAGITAALATGGAMTIAATTRMKGRRCIATGAAAATADTTTPCTITSPRATTMTTTTLDIGTTARRP